MSQECKKELESGIARKWDVYVMTGKANVEIRPTFINKGWIAKRLVNSYTTGVSNESRAPATADQRKGDSREQTSDVTPDRTTDVDFILCMGDDVTDEDMFTALGGLSSTPNGGPGAVADQDVFTVSVGASTKPTSAKWHLLETDEVIDCVTLLAEDSGTGNNVGQVSPGQLQDGNLGSAANAK